MPNGQVHNTGNVVGYAVDHNEDGLLQIHARGCQYGLLCVVCDWLSPMFSGIDIDWHYRWFRENGKLAGMTTMTFKPGGTMECSEKDTAMLFEARLKAVLKKCYGEKIKISVKRMSVDKLITL